MTLSELFNHEGDNITLSIKTVEFGNYYKSSDGIKEPIEWIVLDMQDNKLLLISKEAIDYKSYHESYTEVTWEKCSLRKWLNGRFLNSAFTHDEQSKIAVTTVTADKNPSFDTPPGNNTTDKIFLLSIPEVNKYFSSDSTRQCQATEYAKVQGAYMDSDNGFCWWWLRSPGQVSNDAAYVDHDGYVDNYGFNVDIGDIAVRPALWINL